ncbi:hypothetical protein BCQ_4336 [Bacillus cereus Q1]|uniref:Uncharacterized protein n=1 Tax=Bacillus cereus (strain Q1) TaxID=361100 RepID=B9J032_BACCQ|nr:hypothetical protein BCQ_4336 [Bacillus cereus Q1]
MCMQNGEKEFRLSKKAKVQATGVRIACNNY